MAVVSQEDLQLEPDSALSGTLSAANDSVISFIPADRPKSAGTAKRLSTASDAVFVAYAGDGLAPHLRHQICLAALFGPSNLILAVDGLDDTENARRTYEQIKAAFEGVAEQLGVARAVTAPMPTGAAKGPEWHGGPDLVSLLNDTQQHTDQSAAALRAVVGEQVSPEGPFSCTIVTGDVRSGDPVKIVPGGRQHQVTDVSRNADQPAQVVLTLDPPCAVKPGDVVCAAGNPVEMSDQFESHVVWFGAEPMLPSRPYLMQFASGLLTGSMAAPKYTIKVDTLEHLAAKTLESGELGVCNISLDADIPFAAFRESRALGGFTIIDKFSDEVVGAGVINFALRRASNIHWQALDLNKSARASKLGQKSSVLWFTGLSGSGKSTIANLVEKKLHAMGHQTYLLDGDNVRHGLNRDLGFTDADRVENIRRVAEVARLMADAGLIVLASFISPFRSERRMARDMMDDGEFIEVFVRAPLEVCEERDVKGLYVKARKGEIKNFTGIDSDYELPKLAEIELDTTALDPEQSADEIVAFLKNSERLDP